MRRTPSLLAIITIVSTVIALSTACGQSPGERGPEVLPLPVLPDPTPRETLDVYDLAPKEALSVDGVTVDSETGTVHMLLAGKGILIVPADGGEETLIPFVEGSPWDNVDDDGVPIPAFYDRGYQDIALLPDGAYVLAGPNEAEYFDPEEGAPASYFCLLPGFEEIVMINSALTVDPITDLIIAAPTYYNWSQSDAPIEAYHADYFMDGTARNTRDVLITGVVAEGLARDANGTDLFAVSGDQLSVFTLEGQLQRIYTLEGIADASGLSHDAVADVLYITDRADMELRSFDAQDFRD